MDKLVCAFLYVITKHGYPPPAEQTLEYLREMKSLGFTQVELEGIREEHLMAMYDRRFDVRDELNKLGLSMPVYCTVLPSLSSLDPDKRKAQLELFQHGCLTAKTLGAQYVLDNCPVAPFVFPQEIPIVRHYDDHILSEAILPNGFNWTSFENMLVQQFQTVCDIAAEHELTYLMHPAMGTLCATPEAFLAFHHKVDRSNLAYNFDTANLIALQQNLILAYQQLKAHVPYIHVSDTKLDHHQHLPLGHGDIRWKTFFTELRKNNYDGLIGIDIGGAESKVGALDQSYREAQQVIRNELFR